MLKGFGVIFFPLDFDDSASITIIYSVNIDQYHLKFSKPKIKKKKCSCIKYALNGQPKIAFFFGLYFRI